MTVRELYEWAEKNDALDLDIEAQERWETEGYIEPEKVTKYGGMQLVEI